MFVKPKQFQVLVALSAMLILAPISTRAASIVQAVSLNQRVQRGLQFNAERTLGADSQTRFVVEILAQDVQLPAQFQTFLSVVQQDSHSVSIQGTAADGGRRLDCARERSRLLCSFTVPNQFLASLSFVLDESVIAQGQIMPSSNMLYFNLRDVPLWETQPTQAHQSWIERGCEKLNEAATAAIENVQRFVQSL